MTTKFTISFMELAFLIEACIPPTTLARSLVWDDAIHEYYDQMSPEERAHIYKWITRNSNFKKSFENGDQNCSLFEARFNPENKWRIRVQDNEVIREIECFKWKNAYYISATERIDEPLDAVKIS